MDLNDPNGVHLGKYVHPVMQRANDINRAYGKQYQEHIDAVHRVIDVASYGTEAFKQTGDQIINRRVLELSTDMFASDKVKAMYTWLKNHGPHAKEVYIDMIACDSASKDQRNFLEWFLTQKYGIFLKSLKETSDDAWRN